MREIGDFELAQSVREHETVPALISLIKVEKSSLSRFIVEHNKFAGQVFVPNPLNFTEQPVVLHQICKSPLAIRKHVQFETVSYAGVGEPEKVTEEIREAFTRHPNWRKSEKEMRELRQDMTFALLATDDANRVKTVDTLLETLSRSEAD